LRSPVFRQRRLVAEPRGRSGAFVAKHDRPNDQLRPVADLVSELTRAVDDRSRKRLEALFRRLTASCSASASFPRGGFSSSRMLLPVTLNPETVRAGFAASTRRTLRSFYAHPTSPRKTKSGSPPASAFRRLLRSWNVVPSIMRVRDEDPLRQTPTARNFFTTL
jgi:hypothetical protein